MINSNKATCRSLTFTGKRPEKSSKGRKYTLTGVTGGLIGAATCAYMSKKKTEAFNAIGKVFKDVLQENPDLAEKLKINKPGEILNLVIEENSAARTETKNAVKQFFNKFTSKIFPQKQKIMEFKFAQGVDIKALGDEGKKLLNKLNKGLSHVLGDVKEKAELTLTRKDNIHEPHGPDKILSTIKNWFNKKSETKIETIFEVAGKTKLNPIKLKKHILPYTGIGAILGVVAGVAVTGLAALKKKKSNKE